MPEKSKFKVEYCPTGDMLADFFTKPLQCSIFWKFPNQILNTNGDPAPSILREHRSVLSNQGKCETRTTGVKYTSQNIRGSGPLNTKKFIENEFRGTARNAVLSD
jgi:hypothetical protein